MNDSKLAGKLKGWKTKGSDQTIFHSTDSRPDQTSTSFHHRDALWDPGFQGCEGFEYQPEP